MGLEFRGIKKSFGGEPVLRGVDLTLETGKMLSVVGPSGGGKTTLVRLAAGLEHPDAGHVTIEGRPVRLGEISVAFQDTPLYPHLTVLENVLFPLKLAAGRSKTAGDKTNRRRRAHQALEMMRIGELGPRRIHQLSGGQRQRVGIARALVRDVNLYLFDEPLAHLDPALARVIREDLRSVQRQQGFTMMYVTHHLEEAFALGDTVAVVKDGMVEQLGTPWELWNQPATRFVGEFLGSYPMNFVESPTGKLLGFRPEHCVVRSVPSAGRGGMSMTDGIRTRVRVTGSSFLGEETLLDVESESQQQRLRAIVPSSEKAARAMRGEWVELSVPPGRVHEFDAKTGNRVLAS
ncbi:ABC transporter ATP-binding protein [uncultured Kocuria sp.]|uniref:ABC transporter ATP-binding protein n=1 Tax=uncultured Kocuria sp. TaxID=259305 RepID=UPI002593D5FC|nr:ABC transporter ATP-binding protein [uncultured Kocuria sp.]MCT1367350.1 ABC transporter ATP-binding protein [Rothia sp. p3-SID1597]